MMPVILQERRLLPVTATSLPAVSITMPFEPKMTAKQELVEKLERALAQVSNELEKHCSTEDGPDVLASLKTLIQNLNYSTYKKSIALFVSPVVSKVHYLDILLKEHIAVDETFCMRNLVENKGGVNQYAVLVLSASSMKMFVGSKNEFKRILSSANTIHVLTNDIPERVSNFSDASSRREIMLDKFVQYADHVLDGLLKAYPYPLFVLATRRTGGHFKKLTRNGRHIVGYIHGNFSEAAGDAIFRTVAPYINKWEDVRQIHLLGQLDAALGANRLAVGMRAVYEEACGRNGQLLVVERNCTSPLSAFASGGYEEQPFYIKDAVDVVIEKVLESGGDVEFVNEGVLTPYRKIALIKYY